MTEPSRGELSRLAETVKRLRFFRETESGERIWGLKLIRDLRPAPRT